MAAGSPISSAPTTPAREGQPLSPEHHERAKHQVWHYVANTHLHSLWDFEGASPVAILKRTSKAFMDDNLLSRAAELGYYFLFALFPTLVFVSSLLGIFVRSTSGLYDQLLHYFALVVPQSAYDIVVQTFNKTTTASSSGKIGFGLAAALWSASVGFAAIQDTLNIVYKVKETRPYWKARGGAILVTILLALIVTLTLGVLFAADVAVRMARAQFGQRVVQLSVVAGIHAAGWIVTLGLLILLFAVIYYFAPDVKAKCWRWLTPGAAIGILCWILASVILRVYLHFFDNYSLTYGSLGAVIVLLTWFYITGLTLLLGAEINSEIAAAVAEKRLKEQGAIPEHASADASHPIAVS